MIDIGEVQWKSAKCSRGLLEEISACQRAAAKPCKTSVVKSLRLVKSLEEVMKVNKNLFVMNETSVEN